MPHTSKNGTEFTGIPADFEPFANLDAWRKRRDEREAREREARRLLYRSTADGPASLRESPAQSRGTGLQVGPGLTFTNDQVGDRAASDGPNTAASRGRVFDPADLPDVARQSAAPPTVADDPTPAQADFFESQGGRDPGEEEEDRPGGRGPLVLTDEGSSDTLIGPDGTVKADLTPPTFFVKGWAGGEPKPVRSGSFYDQDDRVRDYDGGGFIQDNRPAPRSVYGRLVSVLTDTLGQAPNADTVRLVAHLWTVGALRHADADAYTPIPWQVLARDVPGADMESLILSGVLDMAPHTYASDGGGRCREWAGSAVVADALDDAMASARPGEPSVNLMTGRPRRGRRPGNKRHDDNGNRYPPQVTAGMDAIPNGVVNVTALRAHLDTLKATADAADGAERGRAKLRWRNDALCFEWMRARGLSPTDVPGIYTYPQAWDAQTAGRIMPRDGGGAQSLSRAGKVACYEGIADVLNYDLRSSQMRILQAELDRLGIGCEWLDRYLADPNAKQTHADACGVPVDSWKVCALAAVMGGAAGVPKHFELKPVTRYVGGVETTTEKPVCAAMQALDDAMGREAAREAWPRVRAELGPLLDAVRQWHRHLREWTDENATDGRGGRFVTNAVGARRDVSELSKGELPRKVAAHVLQGLESFYVHTLATLGDRYGFRVVSNEHDGLVTLGTVPEAAIQEARQACAMPYVELVEKPFL